MAAVQRMLQLCGTDVIMEVPVDVEDEVVPETSASLNFSTGNSVSDCSNLCFPNLVRSSATSKAKTKCSICCCKSHCSFLHVGNPDLVKLKVKLATSLMSFNANLEDHEEDAVLDALDENFDGDDFLSYIGKLGTDFGHITA